MHGKAMGSDYQQNFEAIIHQMEDEQLREVLKKRALYQDEAARAAIKEAIDRDIISSEKDLHSPEYRHEPLRPRLFPKIETARNRNRIRQSIGRGLLLAGLLPVIWGMVRLNAGFSSEGISLMLFGISWMGLSAVLIRKYNKNAVLALFTFIFISVYYVMQLLFQMRQIVFMDLFIVIVLYLLTIYGLLFMLRLRD